MIVHRVAQGSEAWAALRRGIPTASEFGRIVTPGGRLSAQARQYARLLAAEELLDRSLIALDELDLIARGKALEAEAARLYEAEFDIETEPVGLITTDDGRIGASPDRLVGSDGILEIKCPLPQTHIGYIIDGFPDKYKPQVQGQLLVSEREWCHWLSYHPELPPVLRKVPRDEDYIALLREALDRFCEMKEEIVKRARLFGFHDEAAE